MGRRGVRLTDGLIGLATWASATGLVLWFFDWVSRWYVVIALLLVAVAGAMFADAADRRRHANAASPILASTVPAQRQPEGVEPARA